MDQDENNRIEQIGNLSIDRRRKRASIHFRRLLPLLEREYQVLEYLMREPEVRRERHYSEIARGAFRDTEMVPISSVGVIIRRIKSTLVGYGAIRGLLLSSRINTVKLYDREASVKVTALHVPTARFEPGTADGSHQIKNAEVEPVWEGEISEKGDKLICEQLFTYLNSDDRPNGRFAPSMSVGDVITIADGTIEAVSYQVDRIGWIRLKRAIHADPQALEAMKEKLGGRPRTVALS